MGKSKSGLVVAERADLATELSKLGPNQPTLCEGWKTKDLLAHLIMRERRPDAAAGIIIPALNSWRSKVERSYTDKPFADLVTIFAQGPGLVSPFALPGVDNLANLIEFTIHHEDVRRAQPNWQPRTNVGELQAEIAKRLPKFALLALRKLPLGVLMINEQGLQTWLKRGTTVVELHGEPIEILLYISGRQRHANVTVHGSPAALATFERTKFGF